MDVSKYLKSKWLKAEDIPQSGLVVSIQRAYEHTFEQQNQTKPIIELYELDQDLVLNETRVRSLVGLFGVDATQWSGKQVFLTTGETDMGDTIVINAVPKPVTSQPQPQHAEVVFNA